jgi:hypothetical protein
MRITDPHSKWNEGDLFRYHYHIGIHKDIDKEVGIIIRKVAHKGRYKVVVAHKTFWCTIHNMEKIA